MIKTKPMTRKEFQKIFNNCIRGNKISLRVIIKEMGHFALRHKAMRKIYPLCNFELRNLLKIFDITVNSMYWKFELK